MIQRSKQEVAGLQGAAPLRGSLRAERARGHCGIAASITIGLLTIALAISFGYAPADLLVQGLLNPFHVVYFGIFDSRGQRLAHYVLLGGLLVAVILFRRCRKATEWVQSHWADSTWVRASIMKALVAFGLLVLLWQVHTHPIHVALGSLGVVAAYYLSRPILGSITNRGFALLNIAIVLGCTLPGFFVPTDLSRVSPDIIVAIQLHYSIVTSDAGRLAQGQTLFDQVSPMYGVLLPVVFGGWQRHFGPIDMGQYHQVVRWFEFVFLLLALVLFRAHAGRRYLVVLLGVLLVVPWHYFNSVVLLWPNQSAWRAMGFVIAPLGIYLVRAFPVQWMVFAFAFLGSLLVLFNPETGLALSAGLVSFVFCRFYARQGPSLAVVARLAGFALVPVVIVVALLLLVYRIGLGGWPALASFYSASHAIIAFAHGYAGLKASFDPFALLIVGHATYIILWSASAGRQQLSFRQSFRAALATMIVVWFAYYANRPQPMHLWTFVYLYSFIAMDLFCFLHHRLGPWRRLGPSVVFACVVMGTIVIPHQVKYNRLPFKTMSSEIGRIGTDPVASGAVRTSGVYLSKEVADELARKASFLREKNSQAQSGASGPLYLSASSYLISTLSGVYSPLPFVDGFATIFTQRDYQALVDAIVTANRKEIYFDAADNIVAGDENHRRYFRKLQEDLAPFYEVSRAEMGWQVLQRRNGTSVQGHVPSGGRRASG